MKKYLLIYIFAIISANVFAQGSKPYKIDDSVQVSLPADFKKVDTLSQTNITASTTFGNIQINKFRDSPSNTPDIEKLKHLDKYYSNYVKQIKSGSKYSIISDEKDALMGKLHAKDFTMTVDSGSGKQVRIFRIIHENGATYTFQYLYKDISKEYALPESKEFFNSISIPAVDVKSQFTSPGNTTGKVPAGTGNKKYIFIAAGVIILLLILFLLMRKKKE